MHEDHFDALALIKEIIAFIGVSVLAFGWLMLMLLIVSFVGLSYITIKLDTMIWASVIFAVAVDIFYIVRKIRKKREYQRILNNLK